MPEREQYWLFEVRRSDSAFLKSMGIEPCVINDPCPEPLPVPFEELIRHCEMTHVRAEELLTKADHEWLKAMAVAWEPEPECQLPLDFCDRPQAAP
jgi:hypothetical protein